VSDVAGTLAVHLAATSSASSLSALRAHFRARGYVPLPALAPEAFVVRLGGALGAILASDGVRRDIAIAATGGTRRRYAIATREALARDGGLIASLYRAPPLLAFLGAIAAAELVPVPYLPEQFIATRMQRAGDAHGWHWDDYPYALVWVVRAPADGSGGEVELVRDTVWDKARPDVERYLRERSIERFRPRSGSAYLLRADTTMHRVAPLRCDTVRDVLTFSYTDAGDDRAVTHETLEALL
jgi:hypothetical protein